MTTATETVSKQAALSQRQRIPDRAMIIFSESTNEALLSMNSDERLPSDFRAWSRWELDYRTVMGVYLDFDPRGNLRRTSFVNDRDAQGLLARQKQEENSLEQNRRRLVAEMQLRAKSGIGRGKFSRRQVAR